MSRVRISGHANRRAGVASPSAALSRVRRRSGEFGRSGKLAHPGAVEGLERRTLLAAFVVTEPGDDGPGSLRQAILDANTTPGPDTITFNLPGPEAVRTIRPLSPLPEITGQ